MAKKVKDKNQLLKRVKLGYNDFLKDVQKAGKAFINNVSKLETKISRAADKGYNTARKYYGNTKKIIVKEAKDTGNGIKNTGIKVYHSGKGLVSKGTTALKHIPEMTEKGIDYTKETFVKAYDKTSGAVVEGVKKGRKILDTSSKAVAEGVRKGSEFVDNTSKAAADKYNDIKSFYNELNKDYLSERKVVIREIENYMKKVNQDIYKNYIRKIPKGKAIQRFLTKNVFSFSNMKKGGGNFIVAVIGGLIAEPARKYCNKKAHEEYKKGNKYVALLWHVSGDEIYGFAKGGISGAVGSAIYSGIDMYNYGLESIKIDRTSTKVGDIFSDWAIGTEIKYNMSPMAQLLHISGDMLDGAINGTIFGEYGMGAFAAYGGLANLSDYNKYGLRSIYKDGKEPDWVTDNYGKDYKKIKKNLFPDSKPNYKKYGYPTKKKKVKKTSWNYDFSDYDNINIENYRASISNDFKECSRLLKEARRFEKEALEAKKGMYNMLHELVDIAKTNMS